MTRYFLLVIALLSSIYIIAQDYEQQIEDIAEPEAMERGLSDLMNTWYVKRYTEKINDDGYKFASMASDSDYIRRLQALPYVIPMPYNPIVRQCIDQYTERRRNLVEYMLGFESLYFPMIEESLDKYGLPLELKYLTIIESALNTTAFSRAGAAGLWQFMLSTAKLYDLEINSLIDERLNPEKETDAACRFLRDLYNIYHDWTLALAAYNCGGGNVNKAIHRAGGKTDFWDIYQYLPRETRSYVPYFIAAAYVMNYFAYHQLYPVKITAITATDTLILTSPVHFEQIAAVLNVDKEEIKALNPQYKREIIPGNYKPMPVKLPYNKINKYISQEQEIIAYNTETLFPKQNNLTAYTAGKTTKIIHTVKKDETLLKIGNKYGVTTASIRKWNKLGRKTRQVAVGRKLMLYVDTGGF
ncbi:MAG: transglycosylase SLT domain-containing protein [Dysgonamonadaceae bacterium]|jgi:membrane-bound lytic murein transglycosylase D|nr:transglycosylase SLT domain-containing protein [Dysgonamonadaceae bacterium]